MSQETTMLVRTILYQVKTAEDLEAAVIAIEAFCSKDDISSVGEAIARLKEKKERKK